MLWERDTGASTGKTRSDKAGTNNTEVRYALVLLKKVEDQMHYMCPKLVQLRMNGLLQSSRLADTTTTTTTTTTTSESSFCILGTSSPYISE